MRLVGVDFGGKRIGIALGERGITTARKPVEASGKLATDAENIRRILVDEEAEAVVLGVPENEDDEKMARICRQLADRLRELGVTVHLIDEALTSVEADDALRAATRTAAERRKLRDGEAARLILERYFHETGA